MSSTIKDVAKLANVSPSTVSRAISNHPRISDETKKRVYEAMKQLNYVPNIIARSLANKSTHTLGLLLSNNDKELFHNPFYIEVMGGISLYAQKKNYYVLYAYSHDKDDEVQHIKNLVSGKMVDGIILTTVRTNDKCIEYLKEIKHPFVVIGKPENTQDICWVDNDNFHAMYNVVSKFIKNGKRNIAFIGGPDELNVTQYRLNGYKAALENCGIQIEENFIQFTYFTQQCGYDAMKKILNYRKPSVVVTTDDLIAYGAIKYIKQEHYKDIAVVGFNNTPMSSYCTPTLSSVDINAKSLGIYATKLLINQLEKEEVNLTSYIVDTKFIDRQSSRGF